MDAPTWIIYGGDGRDGLAGLLERRIATIILGEYTRKRG